MRPSLTTLALLLVSACSHDFESTALVSGPESPADAQPHPRVPHPTEPSTRIEWASTEDTGEGTELTLPTTWFIDADGDGVGQEPLVDFYQPPGTTPVGGDCDDEDPRVFPGQEAFFEAPRADGTHDFDCDGMEQPLFEILGHCNLGCVLETQGWDADTIPECGEGEAWLEDCVFDESCTIVSDRTRIQACR